MNIKEFVQSRKQTLFYKVSSFEIKPKMVIIQVNDDPASSTYVKGKLKDAAEVGIDANLLKFDESISEIELIKEIEKVNNDPSVDGLIVQMPLPKHINEDKIKLSVKPEKDIDGFHPLTSFIPCTPKGIIEYLKNEGVQIEGKNAVVIGRSNIVGKPMAKLLLSYNASVTQLHSRTTKEDMDFYLRHADIIVVAVGKKWFVNKSQELKKTAVLVDVGINRVDGHLYGDAEPELDIKLQTPVPGGVGLLTRLSLLENLLEAYEKNRG